MELIGKNWPQTINYIVVVSRKTPFIKQTIGIHIGKHAISRKADFKISDYSSKQALCFSSFNADKMSVSALFNGIDSHNFTSLLGLKNSLPQFIKTLLSDWIWISGTVHFKLSLFFLSYFVFCFNVLVFLKEYFSLCLFYFRFLLQFADILKNHPEMSLQICP